MKTVIFSNVEIKFIKERIEIEKEWGDEVYDLKEMKVMESILTKINNPIE